MPTITTQYIAPDPAQPRTNHAGRRDGTRRHDAQSLGCRRHAGALDCMVALMARETNPARSEDA